ncbi:MAG: HD domain-containing protein [Candidatus Micrarchaeota archaeon]
MSTKLSNFIFELGMLKRTPRSGWLSLGIKDCESVAEHSFRMAVLAMILAKMEGANEERVLKMCLLHDLPEARTSDLSYLHAKYAKADMEKAAKDSLDGLLFEKEALALITEFEAQKTKEAIVAKDADYLECIFQAKEYLEIGFKFAEHWIKNAKKKLKTKSARELEEEMEKTSSFEWLANARKS